MRTIASSSIGPRKNEANGKATGLHCSMGFFSANGELSWTFMVNYGMFDGFMLLQITPTIRVDKVDITLAYSYHDLAIMIGDIIVVISG